MRVIPQAGCWIQRTTASLRNVYCGPAHIQSIYASSYLGFNIQPNVSALLLEISRRFRAPYNAILVSNIAHIPQFTLCELWFRSYTMLLVLRTFRVQYSSERICAAIGGISTIEWALNSKHGAKYSAQPPVYAMCTVVPDIYKVFTAPHIQATIFIWTNLRCNWRYLDN
jgi:hypothetical protein